MKCQENKQSLLLHLSSSYHAAFHTCQRLSTAATVLDSYTEDTSTQCCSITFAVKCHWMRASTQSAAGGSASPGVLSSHVSFPLNLSLCGISLPERPSGDDRHSDDGIHSGDGERGEGDSLHSSVFIQQLWGGNAIWHRGCCGHLDQQGGWWRKLKDGLDFFGRSQEQLFQSCLSFATLVFHQSLFPESNTW